MKNNNFELNDCNNPTASSSNNNRGAKLIWRNVFVFAKADANASKFMRGKKQTKRIINNSTGYVKPGVLLAVMGARYMQHCISLTMNYVILIWSDFMENCSCCDFQWCRQKYADVGIGSPQSGGYNR